MRVLAARVDWKDGFGNAPRLEVLVDEIPPIEAMEFEHRGGLWYAEQDGFVRYFAWDGPDNEGGFGGRHFQITTVAGEQAMLKGPWSSRAGAMNNAGFGPCVDVSITDNPEGFERGRTLKSGALSLRVAKQAIDLVDDASHLKCDRRYAEEEPVWVPVRDELSIEDAMYPAGEPGLRGSR